MKKFSQFIYEADKKDEENDKDGKEKDVTRRANIKFTIWEEPKKKVNWISNNEKYQKIEYKYEDKEKNIFIDFLLGYNKDKDTWELWAGKIGGVTYDDDPLCDLKTNDFSKCIIAALDKIEEYIDTVEEDPSNWVQYYKNI